MARRKQAQATTAATGLREAMAAKYRERLAQTRDEGMLAHHWTREAERWASGKPMYVAAWQIPRAYRPAGADDFDRFEVAADGSLSPEVR